MNKDFYQNYISTQYHDDIKNVQNIYRKRFYLWKSYLEKLLPTDKNMPILEVGSGFGQNLYSLKELGFTNVLGLDLSPQCVAFCQKQGFNALLVQTEEKFYGEHQKQFDLVILYDVLEHYLPEEGSILLKNIQKVMKTNASLLISVPNANHPFSPRLLFDDITHRFIYNKKSLLQLLGNCGFEKNQIFEINSFTLYDDSFLFSLFKQTFLRAVSFLGELSWKTLAGTQGIFLSECKPTLVSLSRRP